MKGVRRRDAKVLGEGEVIKQPVKRILENIV
jgi:hypothetical protein